MNIYIYKLHLIIWYARCHCTLMTPKTAWQWQLATWSSTLLCINVHNSYNTQMPGYHHWQYWPCHTWSFGVSPLSFPDTYNSDCPLHFKIHVHLCPLRVKVFLLIFAYLQNVDSLFIPNWILLHSHLLCLIHFPLSVFLLLLVLWTSWLHVGTI